VDQDQVNAPAVRFAGRKLEHPSQIRCVRADADNHWTITLAMMIDSCCRHLRAPPVIPRSPTGPSGTPPLTLRLSPG
jgi:hypothetical protein